MIILNVTGALKHLDSLHFILGKTCWHKNITRGAKVKIVHDASDLWPTKWMWTEIHCAM